MKKLIVFDVNETLLDLRALDPHFKRVFGDAAVRAAWFAQVLHSSLAATITGHYHDFGKIAGAALDMVAARHNRTLAEADKSAILGTIRTLPAHADVTPALERLRAAGFRLFTLTNSPPPVVEAQLQNAGLGEYFERILSVDKVKQFKPAAAVYRMAAAELETDIARIRLVACHDWDVAGALAAGCATAFVARPGMVLNPLMPAPDISGRDLVEVAEKIVQADA